ncbi:hypothetical protein ABIB15_001685 [Marisediminicola sp. UYEF4]
MNNSYWLQPPKNIDPTQTLILLPSRTPTIATITAAAKNAVARKEKAS